MGKLTDKKILIINTGDCWTIDGTITESLDLYYNLKEYGIDSDIALFFNPIRLDHIKKDCVLYFAEKQNGNFHIEIMNIDKDHIHFLLTIKPCESISNVVKSLKQHSTYYMWKNYYQYMRQYYWKQHHLWTRGYFICTIGECSEDTIKHYIKNQG